jgi:hypothetical protein
MKQTAEEILDLLWEVKEGKTHPTKAYKILSSQKENKVIKLIKKYRETIYTLKENRDRKTEGDTYDYELDIKLCLEVVKDLENVL